MTDTEAYAQRFVPDVKNNSLEKTFCNAEGRKREIMEARWRNENGGDITDS